MTFALGRRFIIVDGVERWKDKELDAARGGAERDAAGTTVAFFAREDSRAEGPEAPPRGGPQGRRGRQRRGQRQAVGAAEVGDRARPRARARSSSPTPPARWSSTSASASSGCCASSRSSRSAPRRAAASTLAEVEELTAPSAERRAWSLADALVGGEPAPRRGMYSRCERRASACRACSTGCPSGCGPRTRSPRRSRPASRPPRSSAACGCPREPPTG